ncbi:MAG: hypothetical protein AAGI23_17045, partial [Bacteroidota bacterium]
FRFHDGIFSAHISLKSLADRHRLYFSPHLNEKPARSEREFIYPQLLIKEVEKGNLYNEHFTIICDFGAEFGRNRFENFGYYGLRHQPRKLDKNVLNLKRQKIGILKFNQIEKLNKINNLTKFWNRLY